MPPSWTELIGRIGSPQWFGVALEAFLPRPQDLTERTSLVVRVQIFFPFQGQGGEVMVCSECAIHDPQARCLTVKECAQIAMMEAGPTDPGEARLLELPDRRALPSETVCELLANFYTEALTVQILEAGVQVDSCRATLKRIMALQDEWNLGEI